MNRVVSFLITLSFLVAVSYNQPAHAQGPYLDVEPNEVTIGEVFTVTVLLDHTFVEVPIFPQLEERWGPIEVREQGPAETVLNSGNLATTRQQIVGSYFGLGDFATPPFTVTLRRANGNLSEIVIEPITVTVRSVITSPVVTSTELALIGPRPQAVVPHPWWDAPWVWGGVVAFLFMLTAGWTLWRRRANRHEPEDVRSPLERIQDNLHQLDPNLESQAFAIRLSDLVRDYLAFEFDLPARDLTTTEIEQMLADETGDDLPRLLDLLHTCDLTKFAGLPIDPTEQQSLRDQAIVLIDADTQYETRNTKIEM